MNDCKSVGAVSFAVGALSMQDWIMIIGIVITVLGMVQEYLKGRK